MIFRWSKAWRKFEGTASLGKLRHRKWDRSDVFLRYRLLNIVTPFHIRNSPRVKSFLPAWDWSYFFGGGGGRGASNTFILIIKFYVGNVNLFLSKRKFSRYFLVSLLGTSKTGTPYGPFGVSNETRMRVNRQPLFMLYSDEGYQGRKYSKLTALLLWLIDDEGKESANTQQSYATRIIRADRCWARFKLV